MFVRQTKVTLNSPFHQINSALWETKRQNWKKLKENIQLKTKMVKTIEVKAVKGTEDTEGSFLSQLERRYRKLAEVYQQGKNWIKDINSQIEQRRYEELCVQVKKIENTLKKTTNKAVKMEKKLKKIYLKEKNKQTLQCQTSGSYQCAKEDPVNELENDKKKLQNLLQNKIEQVQHLELSSRDLNKELMYLLTIKNALRDEAKKMSFHESKVVETRTSFLKAQATKTS